MIYDYLIIGAGPAGCICAEALSRKGFSVCVVEKRPEHYRKVCGDGISNACVKALTEIGFPVDRFTETGAVKIKDFILYKEGEKSVEHLSKTVYGLARDKTDDVFRRWLMQDGNVGINYNTKIDNLVSFDDGYRAGDYCARNIVVASGAGSAIRLDGKLITGSASELPVGMSTIIKARRTDSPFFLFDYREEYNGTYAWIFSVSETEYNVGIWLKTDRSGIRQKLRDFISVRAEEYLGDDIVILKEAKGAVMGIGPRRRRYNDSIFFLGDASFASNPQDGEGISRAVKDAVEFVKTVEKMNQGEESENEN